MIMATYYIYPCDTYHTNERIRDKWLLLSHVYDLIEICMLSDMDCQLMHVLKCVRRHAHISFIICVAW